MAAFAPTRSAAILRVTFSVEIGPLEHLSSNIKVRFISHSSELMNVTIRRFNLQATKLFIVTSATNRNRNRNLKTSKALLKSQAHQGTSLFTSAATNQRGVSKGGSREAQVRIPEYQEGTE